MNINKHLYNSYRSWLYPLVLLLLSITTLFLNFKPGHLTELPVYGFHSWEQYDSQLAVQLRSVDDLVNRVKAEEKQLKTNSDLVRLELLSSLVRRRFYHGYSIYSLRENWIAAVMSRYVWYDLGAIVDPDDLMQYPMASCSQASLVVMAALRQLNISSRKVSLNGHFALEAKVGDRWYFVDANEEPDFKSIGGRKGLEEILASSEQYKLYGNTDLDSGRINSIFERPMFGEANIYAAPNALAFHRITGFLSRWLWVLPTSFLSFYLLRFNRRVSSTSNTLATI